MILRMRSVPALDATALHNMQKFYDRCKKSNITLILSHVVEQPYRAMEKAGFVDLVGKDNFCKNIDEALERAESLK